MFLKCVTDEGADALDWTAGWSPSLVLSGSWVRTMTASSTYSSDSVGRTLSAAVYWSAIRMQWSGRSLCMWSRQSWKHSLSWAYSITRSRKVLYHLSIVCALTVSQAFLHSQVQTSCLQYAHKWQAICSAGQPGDHCAPLIIEMGPCTGRLPCFSHQWVCIEMMEPWCW